jgi:hypothetical protein
MMIMRGSKGRVVIAWTLTVKLGSRSRGGFPVAAVTLLPSGSFFHEAS